MSMEPVSISCDECRLQGTDACADCVVTFLCEGEPSPVSLSVTVPVSLSPSLSPSLSAWAAEPAEPVEPAEPMPQAGEAAGAQALGLTPGRPPGERGAVIIDAAEARAVRMLQDAGLVPRLRFERRVG